MSSLKSLLLLMLAAGSLRAQCAGCTQIVGPIYSADGNPYNGTLLISHPVPFTSADGRYNLNGVAITLTIVNGNPSATLLLEPTDTASPAGMYYIFKSAVAGVLALTCRVPTSGSSVQVKDICTAAVPSSISSSLITSTSSKSAGLNFASLGDGTCADQTFTFAGVLTSSQIELVEPSGLPLGVRAIAFVPSAGTVDIRVCNLSGAMLSTGVLTYALVITNYTLSSSATLTFSAIPDGSCGSQTMTIAGAVPGDRLLLMSPSTLAAGLDPSGRITSANTITVTLCNLSGATLTPSGLFTAAIAR